MSSIRLCPGSFPTLATESQSFQYYNFRNVRIEFIPQLSSATNGNIWWAPVSDYQTMQTIPAADIDAMQQLLHSKTNPIWGKSFTDTWPASFFKKLTTTGETKFTVKEGDSYNDDDTDNDVQGYIAYCVYGYANYTDVVGTFKISYTCDLSVPKENADGNAASEHCVSAGAGLANTVTALNNDRYGEVPVITWSESPTGTMVYTFNRRGNFLVVQHVTGATLTFGSPAAVADTYGAVVRCLNVSTATTHTASYWVTAREGFSFTVAITNHANITAWITSVTSARRRAVDWYNGL